jgi:hypothetical protein
MHLRQMQLTKCNNIAYNQRMEQKQGLSHDAIDALVSAVINWYQRYFQQGPDETEDVAFSDEWERKQIARELHWN